MAQVINTNSLSLLTQNNLNKSQSALNTAIERLSSGMRINSAKDDAAGQAIANRFTANIKGLTQASRNANDGISIAQTTEGALTEINNNLQRVRELSVQAANGTNSASDLSSIQDEIDQRLAEINRVSEQTQFNGVKVLSADAGKLTIQVGANDGQTIDIDLEEISAQTLGLAKLDVTNAVSSKSLSEAGNFKDAVDATAATTVKLNFPASSATYTMVSGDDGKLYAKSSDATAKYYEATFDGDANTVTFDTATPMGTDPTPAADQTNFVDADGNLVSMATIGAAAQVDDNAGNSNYKVYRENDTGDLYVMDGTDSWKIDQAANKIDLTTGEVTLTTKETTPKLAADFTAADFTEATDGTDPRLLTIPGTAAVDAETYDTTDAFAGLGGTNALLKSEDGSKLYIKNTDADGKVAYYEATADADGVVSAGDRAVVDPLASIDSALAKVDELRSSLGAVQNRFDSAIANLGTTITNLSSSRSRIEDADYAVEVSNMTRAQILQQAGTSVLAQANQTTQGVLSLLR